MNKELKNIQLEVSLNELNSILESLGHLPYVQVFNLIESLRQQAISQVKAQQVPAAEPELAMN
jgi:hypothetical protein